MHPSNPMTLCGSAFCSSLAALAPLGAAEPVSLFDGKSLDGGMCSPARRWCRTERSC